MSPMQRTRKIRNPRSTIKVLLAHDRALIRSCLRNMLEQQEGIKVVGEATDGREAVRLAGDLGPDVVVMDVAMPNLNGIEATRQITDGNGGTKILALSADTREKYVLDMLKAGAAGYLLTTCSVDQLLLAVRTVANGKTYLTPELAYLLVADYRSGNNGDGSADLTPREREVLQLVAEGHSTKGIARHLHLSDKTIESHRQHLMEKLDLHNIADLTKYALREGVTTLEA